MNTETLTAVLLYCTLINFGLLALWGLLFVLPHEWLYRWQARRVRMSPDQFDALNAAGIGLYKILIILFNLAPYLALRIIG
jgi:hypothetical protein